MSMERRGRKDLALVTGTRSTPSGGRNESQGSLFPHRWARIRKRAQDKNLVFENLHHHINAESLKEAFEALSGQKAVGVDEVTKEDYGKNLEANLKDLEIRVQRGSYRPQPKREVLIPKADGRRTRPIAIACFEDKLVDWVIGRILSEVYEPLFIRNSFGYRPNKSAHQAVEACYYSVSKNRRPHAVEIDFSNFFNTIPHRRLIKILSKRITDRRFKGIIGRFLVADLITAQGEQLPSTMGTPQGSIMSPILANIYLHEALDLWFIENYASYSNVIIRYADDAVFFFSKEEVAEKFREELEGRCQRFGLKLNLEKTRRFDIKRSSHESFNFLGFTFYWGKQGSRTILKLKTQKEKLHQAIAEFYHWVKRNRSRMKLKSLWNLAKAKITGHIHYFGYWMNATKINHFYWAAIKSLFKWLNRRSQIQSYEWEGFCERLRHFPLMTPLGKLRMRKLGRSPYVHI